MNYLKYKKDTSITVCGECHLYDIKFLGWISEDKEFERFITEEERMEDLGIFEDYIYCNDCQKITKAYVGESLYIIIDKDAKLSKKMSYDELLEIWFNFLSSRVRGCACDQDKDIPIDFHDFDKNKCTPPLYYKDIQEIMNVEIHTIIKQV